MFPFTSSFLPLLGYRYLANQIKARPGKPAYAGYFIDASILAQPSNHWRLQSAGGSLCCHAGPVCGWTGHLALFGRMHKNALLVDRRRAAVDVHRVSDLAHVVDLVGPVELDEPRPNVARRQRRRARRRRVGRCPVGDRVDLADGQPFVSTARRRLAGGELASVVGAACGRARASIPMLQVIASVRCCDCLRGAGLVAQ
jgi:hypothetical protein